MDVYTVKIKACTAGKPVTLCVNPVHAHTGLNVHKHSSVSSRASD